MCCASLSWIVNTTTPGVWECMSDLWDLSQVDGGECVGMSDVLDL